MRLKFDRWQDAWIAAGLFALTLLSRIPFRSQIFYHWDSVNFAYAMREFSVAKEQPQPPGYIMYVWLCRLVDLLFGDAQTTMVWVSIVASALAVVALFYLGRAMFDARAGLIAALFLVTSPLFWFYGEIALPHSVDMLLVIVSAWWLYETMQGRHRYLYPAITVLAVAGGVRPQTLVFLAPLILFALRKVGWKRFFTASVLGAVICLAWFVPLMAQSGGINAYMETMSVFTGRFNVMTSVFMGAGWWGVRRNVVRLTIYALFGWGVSLVPFVAYVAARVWRREWPGHWEKPLFFALWLAPTLFFYALIHMGQQGLVFVFLPALLLWGAVGLVRLFAPGSRRRLSVVAATLLAINVALFCLAPEHPLGGDGLRLLTRATLINSDRYYQNRFEAIEANFAPESTAILATNWHHIEYYLPEYVWLPFEVGGKWDKDKGSPKGSSREMIVSPTELGLRPDGQGQVAIVIFDPPLTAFGDSPTLNHGEELEYFVLTEEQAFYYGSHSFGVREN
jgi:hypothetical protein